MLAEPPYLSHIGSSEDLITPYSEIRAGFVALALERNRRATPTVEEARALRTIASKASTPTDLLKIERISSALLTAAGVSEKAASHMQPNDKQEAIEGLICNFLEPAGQAFIEELVYRFLLTRGDTLGGSMRNLGGAIAQQKVTRTILAALAVSGIPYQWLPSGGKTWVDMPKRDSGIELQLRGLSWRSNHIPRTMVYNLTIPFVRKNVDICLLECLPADCEKRKIYSEESAYIAIGELKGGIDPAGADEHWKTARTALDRVRKAFEAKDLHPATFFVAAAIVNSMAKEIWEQLESGMLTNSANLTNVDHVESLCQWLVNL